MKPDTYHISRLEAGDHFQNTRGETCVVKSVDNKGNISAAVTGRGDPYDRSYDSNGNGSLGEKIKTP